MVCFPQGRSGQLGWRHPLETPMCLAYAAHPVAVRPIKARFSLVRRRFRGSDRGTTVERKLYVAIMALAWEAIGFTLALAKGQLSRTVTWIGGTLTIDVKGVAARVKESIVEDILCDLARFRGESVVTKKELHSRQAQPRGGPPHRNETLHGSPLGCLVRTIS